MSDPTTWLEVLGYVIAACGIGVLALMVLAAGLDESGSVWRDDFNPCEREDDDDE